VSARILIVDDTPSSVKMPAAKLTNEYYEVPTADAGRVALKAVEENAPAVTGSSRRRRRRLGMSSRPGPDRRHEKTPVGRVSTHF
jgi:DNA-binding NtrC family response regulator